MKKIFILVFSCFMLHTSLSAQTLMDTTAMQAAAALYQPKSLKNGVAISPIAPLAIHQRADNKLEYVRSLMQGQITNINSLLPLKLNVSDTVGYYAKYHTVFDASNYVQVQRFLDSLTSQRNNINYVVTNTEAVYQKKVAFATANNIAYVSKKYTVAGDAAYNEQLNAATIGSPIATYPTIKEARKAICEKLYSKEIPKGVIYVNEGNVYRVAENTDTSGLGTFDWVYRQIAANTRYHPYPSTTSVTDDDSLCLSLAYPNLDVIFAKGSGITHVAGRGQLAYVWDTIAPQRILGVGSFSHNITNDRTNNGSGNGTNVNAMVGYSQGEFQFSGDSLKIGRLSPSYSGWTMLSAGASRLIYNFGYVSTYENNSLFRGYGGQGSVIEIDRLVTDTTVLPYMYQNNPYSPTAVFLNNGGYGCNVYIKSAYIASNPLVSYGFYGVSGQINFRCDKIEQKFRTSYQTELIGSAQSTTPQAVGAGGSRSAVISWGTWTNTHKMKNFSLNVEVGSYVGQNTLLIYDNPSDIRNASIKFDFGSIKQDSNSIYPKTSIYINQSSGTIDSSVFVINANVLNFNAEAIKVFGNPRIKFNGTYKTNSAVRNAVWVNGVNSNTIFDGSAVVQGTQASMEGTSGSSITCLPSSTANTSASSNVSVTGTLNVNSAYKQ